MTKFYSKLKFLWEIIGAFKPMAVLLLFLIIIGSITESISLAMIMPFFEEMIHAEKVSGLRQYLAPVMNIFKPEQRIIVIAAGILLMIVIKNIIFMLRVCVSNYFVWKLRENWMKQIMNNFLYAPYYRVITDRQGVILNNIISEPSNAAASLTDLIEYVGKIIITISLFSVLFVTDWKITLLIGLFFTVVIGAVNKITYKYSAHVGSMRLKLSQELTAQAAETISGSRETKIFSMENKIFSLFRDNLKKLTSMLLKFKIVNRLPQPVTEFLIVSCLVLILFYVNTIMRKDILSILPLLGVFVVISQQLSANLAALYSQRNEIITYLPSLKLVHALAAATETEKNISQGNIIKNLSKDIVLKDVRFSYSGSQPLFDGLSLKIPYGKMTAIIGSSGSGKSTVADLLIGLFQKENGQILINGIDISELNLSSWRRLVGFVSQETFLLNATVRENILVGRPDAGDDEIIEAAKKAKAHDFITELSDGYNTIVGDRGVKLSGGQRQRIAIARAIIKKPDFFIFDEATSSLDTETEKIIQKSIEEIGKEKTVLVIAHRLSTIENADVVYRIENGKVEGVGEKEGLK
ncbi:MAG: ABC transporter ATP-binding protein [Nitrospirae bacterium]|nr:ABC transporter ATP-binding protein [Nitrospirota bacterium]